MFTIFVKKIGILLAFVGAAALVNAMTTTFNQLNSATSYSDIIQDGRPDSP